MDNEITAASSETVVDVATEGTKRGKWRWSQSRFDPSWSCHICATYTTPALYMVHFRKIHKDGTMPVQSFDLSGISLVRCGYCRWICRTNGLSEHQGQSGACSGRGQTDKQALDGVSRSHKEFCICSTTLHRLPHRATSFEGNCLATDGHQCPQTGFSQ